MRPIAPAKRLAWRYLLALALLLAVCPTMTRAGSFGMLVKDINTTAELFSSSPDNSAGFEQLGNRVVFKSYRSYSSERGRWSTDGTPAGTAQIMPGLQVDYDQRLVSLNGAIFFIGHTKSGSGLWRSDGTTAGTTLLAQLPRYRDRSRVFRAGNRLFFTVFDYNTADGVAQLWTSDGTAPGTHMLTTLAYSAGISLAHDVNGVLFFSTGDDHSLWRTDGTPEGAQVITNSDLYEKTIHYWRDLAITSFSLVPMGYGRLLLEATNSRLCAASIHLERCSTSKERFCSHLARISGGVMARQQEPCSSQQPLICKPIRNSPTSITGSVCHRQ